MSSSVSCACDARIESWYSWKTACSRAVWALMSSKARAHHSVKLLWVFARAMNSAKVHCPSAYVWMYHHAFTFGFARLVVDDLAVCCLLWRSHSAASCAYSGAVLGSLGQLVAATSL
eukprot:CAMPEP_0174287424 /NCGR_PEP_ID=MMETSP0809-20121228/16047_1 /TAXON_ID=73025 ORGANISM="Eutreptiella gymnastica-like, Strain CCMP1594" /NCGR_SAMPLE_ID=MMETSP0809 /ASSEMBLY_ACC=CAM_ASM_000658 /LENGTH=116 /DNA_ID=CAMNT_0015383983 /DNA_START=48 /DNA_END=398 /DNA_ORIENTATION=-